MAEAAKPIQLIAQTVEAFDAYVRKAEAEMKQTQLPDGPFLWCDRDAKRSQQVRGGAIPAQFWTGKEAIKVPNGLIHDWIGAVFVPGMTVQGTLALIQDYDNHKKVYSPEVMDSKLMNRSGNDFRVYLRLLKKKILTVVMDTEHEVHYRAISPVRWICDSYTKRISEVEDAESPEEKVKAPDTGYGFLWRLYSYWRFQERDNGVYIECRAISLTRDVPFGLGWIIEPIIQELPKESLIRTLEATRAALQAKPNVKASISSS